MEDVWIVGFFHAWWKTVQPLGWDEGQSEIIEPIETGLVDHPELCPLPMNWQSFLHCVLRRRKIPKSADNRPEHLRRQFPQQVLGRNLRWWSGHSHSFGALVITCRTSIGKPNGTSAGPRRNSLASGKTPSVIGSPSFPATTILAWSGIPRPSVAP